jgi:hypothetical protein
MRRGDVSVERVAVSFANDHLFVGGRHRKKLGNWEIL